MTAATKLTQEKRETFLLHLANHGSVTKACELCGISREGIYKVRDRDEEFAEQWERARRVASDALEDEAWRRANEGNDRPLHFQGKLTGDYIREYSDILLIFLLKGNKPTKFAERHQHEGNLKTENTVIYLPENKR